MDNGFVHGAGGNLEETNKLIGSHLANPARPLEVGLVLVRCAIMTGAAFVALGASKRGVIGLGFI